MTIVSSRTRERMSGAEALPTMVRIAAKPSDRPNHTSPASWWRTQKNRWKKVNPTLARTSSIAFDASTTVSECSSRRSSLPAVRPATTSRGSRVAAVNAKTKIAAEYSNVAVGPIVFCMIPAGTIAQKPTRPEISPSFEFASTSSSSVRTTLGTSALLEMA